MSLTGAVTATIFNSDGSTGNDTGTIGSDGKFSVREAGGDGIDGTLSQNSTTHVFSMSYTEPNGTKGMLSVGLAPTASPLAGSYSGTATNTAQTQSLPLTLTISAIGVVTATLGTPVAGNPNSGFTLTGYVDTNGNLYLADISGGVPENLFAALTLSGTSLTGPTHISAADGYSNTGTLSLIKHSKPSSNTSLSSSPFGPGGASAGQARCRLWTCEPQESNLHLIALSDALYHFELRSR